MLKIYLPSSTDLKLYSRFTYHRLCQHMNFFCGAFFFREHFFGEHFNGEHFDGEHFLESIWRGAFFHGASGSTPFAPMAQWAKNGKKSVRKSSNQYLRSLQGCSIRKLISYQFDILAFDTSSASALNWAYFGIILASCAMVLFW